VRHYASHWSQQHTACAFVQPCCCALMQAQHTARTADASYNRAPARYTEGVVPGKQLSLQLTNRNKRFRGKEEGYKRRTDGNSAAAKAYFT
jgi:hypothetical protein